MRCGGANVTAGPSAGCPNESFGSARGGGLWAALASSLESAQPERTERLPMVMGPRIALRKSGHTCTRIITASGCKTLANTPRHLALL